MRFSLRESLSLRDVVYANGSFTAQGGNREARATQ
jgi:hypothetical protein